RESHRSTGLDRARQSSGCHPIAEERDQVRAGCSSSDMNRPQAMMIRGWIRATLAGACLLATIGCEAESTDPSSQASAETSLVLERIGPRVGTTAPNFQLWDLDGKPISLSQYQGRVVSINFWATWCGLR